MKVCDECGDKHYAKGKCKLHYRMPSQLNPKPIKKTGTPIGSFVMTKNPTPIPKVSSKEKKRQVAYNALRKEFMKQFPMCQVQLSGCLGTSTDIHHLYFGADRYGHFLDSSSWKTTCRHCHHLIHDVLSSKELITLGLRLK